MEFQELKNNLRRLYQEHIRFHLKRIFFCLFLSICIAGTTSTIAWLLDPAVKKIFIDKNQTLAWVIPIAIILAFATKGLSLYFARLNINIVGQRIAGELQKKIAKSILFSDIQTLDSRHSGKYISNLNFDELKKLVEAKDYFYRLLTKVNNLEDRQELRTLFGKSFYASKNIEPDEVFSWNNVKLLKPVIGIKAKDYKGFLGTNSNRKILAGEPIYLQDMEDEKA